MVGTGPTTGFILGKDSKINNKTVYIDIKIIDSMRT